MIPSNKMTNNKFWQRDTIIIKVKLTHHFPNVAQNLPLIFGFKTFKVIVKYLVMPYGLERNI